MKIRTKPFVLGAMLTTCSLAVVTSITSTFAWYSYNTKNGMAFSGVATGATENLQVRITGEDDTKWRTSLSKSDLIDYSYKNGFANENLSPVTQAKGISSSGTTAGKLGPSTESYGFYGAPTALKPKSPQNNIKTVDSESKEHYVFFRSTIEFRCINPVDTTEFYEKNIYISFMEVRATSEGKDITKGLRVHFNQSSSNCLIAPGYSEDKTIDLTGKLALSPDTPSGSYDKGIRTSGTAGSLDATYRQYIEGYDDPTKLEEVIYGNYENAKESSLGLDNTITTFTDGKATTPKTCIGTTNADGTPIAVNITIWLEGWDPAVIDSNYNATFDLGIQFEVETL